MSDTPRRVLSLLGLDFTYTGTVPDPVRDPRRGLYLLATTRGRLLGKSVIPCLVGSAIGPGGIAAELHPGHPQFLLAAASDRPVHIYTCPLVDSDLVILSIERRLLAELHPAWNREEQPTAA